jgi:hypothetical protein
MQPKRSTKPAPYEGTNNPDNDVDDNAETAAVDDTSCQSTGNASNN